jgi:hypothetical protein
MSYLKFLRAYAVFGAFCFQFASAAEKSVNALPLVVLSGADSRYTGPSYELIKKPSELTKAWAKHLGTSEEDAYRPALVVDFDRCMVVAVFRGERRNVRGIEVEPLVEGNGAMTIRFSEIGYQTGGKGNLQPPDRPYAFIVVPKSSKSIVLEENVQQYKGQPPIWKQSAKLPAN